MGHQGVLLALCLSAAWALAAAQQANPAAAQQAPPYPAASAPFIRVRGSQLVVGEDGGPYYFVGANYWQGANVAALDAPRLRRELDTLVEAGVTQLRVSAGSEGPDTEPWRIVPSLQPAPGVYNDEVLAGLETLIFEMGVRGMRATMVLNNMWHWSGGFAAYGQWALCEETPGCDVDDPAATLPPVPYPSVPTPLERGEDPSDTPWADFVAFASGGFLGSARALQMFEDHIVFITNHTSSLTGLRFKDDPTIMAFQLANEPRAAGPTLAQELQFSAWINDTATFVKTLAPKQLVSTGMEGNWAGRIADHCAHPSVDYCTAHLWVHNWGVWKPESIEAKAEATLSYAGTYIRDAVASAAALGKPIALEEFGFPRDGGSLHPDAPTTVRDRYYAAVLGQVALSAALSGPLAGANFWAFSGEGQPEFVEDPAQEAIMGMGATATRASATGEPTGSALAPSIATLLAEPDPKLVSLPGGFMDPDSMLELRNNLQVHFDRDLEALTLAEALDVLEAASSGAQVDLPSQYAACQAAYAEALDAGAAGGAAGAPAPAPSAELGDLLQTCVRACYTIDSQRFVFCPEFAWWKAGRSIVSDPPHEVSGWYAVYGADTTLDMIRNITAEVHRFAPAGGL